ncbi:MAG: tubulin-like doman-containing protein [Chloroflexota bacterium]
MPVPALIVGLGGTGVWVATYVKKELLEVSNAWPSQQVKIIAFDTVAQPEATIGGRGQIRRAGQTTGAVRLDAGEFFFIGGNVQGLMREVAAGKHPHLGTWLLADWYLQTLADRTFNLNEGAGQFRQFGRLAVFRDVAAPSNSTIYNTLSDALVKLKRSNPTMKSLQVFIVASLAGGTGAGMFADVAHLIREIASQPNVDLKGKMTIRGYLVLPDAFSRTVDQAWLRSMYARAYAAMRESRRFTVSFDYERGYPMHYHEGAGHPLWHGAIKGKLFDLIYYLDGQGGQNSLAAVTLPNGVAPAIADAISAAIDAKAGPDFANYVANIEAERAQRIGRADLSAKTATFGSVGTYTIVFPIYHVVEAWTHDLGLELLNNLLSPTEFDSRTGTPTRLANNANQEDVGEDGEAAGFKFLRSLTPITYDYRDEDGNLQTQLLEPTLLPGELARIAAEAMQPSSGVIQHLTGRQVADWKDAFVPTASDRETQRLLQRVESTLQARLYDRQGKLGQVQTSEQKEPKEDPVAGAERIIQEVRVYKNRYLGSEDPRTGQRSGGLYRTALEQIVEHHTARFNLGLDLTIQAILNGKPNNASTIAKSGKLGFLHDFLTGLFEGLEKARDTLQRVQQLRREQGESRRTAIAAAQSATQTMRSNANKKTTLGRRVAHEAYEGQHSYLQAEASLVDILQVEATEEAILQATNRMLDYVLSAQQSVQAWEETLARDSDGLYAKLLRGRRQVDSDRQAGQDVKVRFIVSDPAYEKARYQEYLHKIPGGWVNQLLGNLTWKMDQKVVAGRPKVNLSLQVVTEGNQPTPIGADTFDDNLALWLRLSRQAFDDANEEESVIAYLMRHREYRDPTRLAEMIHANSGTLLNFSGGAPLPANFLRAYFQTEEEAGHRGYLRSVMQNLAQLSGQSTTETVRDEEGQERVQESRFVRFLNSEDRFKFTLVFTQELIELDRIDSYRTTGHNAYLGSGDRLTLGDRRLLHVFPAEVHAAAYEGRLPELKQPVRLFSDDVTLQLEDLDRFKLFLMAYTYGLIRRVGMRDQAGNQRNLWQLSLPPAGQYGRHGEAALEEVFWLTDPLRPPHILEALMTFNFVGLDVRYKQGYASAINHQKVADAVARVRDEDAQRRIQAGTAGQGSPDLLGQAQALDPEAHGEVLLELARIDQIREMQGRLENQVLPAYKDALNDPDNQKDYDVASVFALTLRSEVEAVRRTVTDTINALRDLGQKGAPPAAEVKRIDLL